MFLLWLVVANDWLTRHMGVGFNGPILVAALGALGAGFGAIEAATGEKLKEKWLGRLVETVLQTPILAGLYAVLLVALAGWSSVTILNDPANTVFDAALTPADSSNGTPAKQDNRDAPANPVRFSHVWVGPLGRPYRLEVKGYLPQIFNVYPVAGVSLSPRRDLRVTPSVLLRPPFDALAPMAGGVRVVVSMETTTGSVTVADTTVKQQSILIGIEQPIPQALLEGWRLDAVAQRITSESLLAQLLECWKQPLVLAPQTPLEPGRVIKATIYNPTKQPLAEVRAILSEDRLQDIAMSATAPADKTGSRRKESHP